MTKTLILAVWLFSSVGFADVETKAFGVEGLESVQVDNMSGAVKVSVSSDNLAHVVAEKKDFAEGCKLTVERKSSKLVVENNTKGKGGWFSSANCEVDLDIQVPQATNIEVEAGSSRIEITGLTGKVNFDIGSGRFVSNANLKELTGHTGSGAIEVKGQTGATKLRTGSGDISVTLNEVPTSGGLDLHTGSGDATVILPASMKVLTDLSTGSGKVYNEVGDSSDAKYKVSMQTGSGDLNLKKLKQ